MILHRQLHPVGERGRGMLSRMDARHYRALSVTYPWNSAIHGSRAQAASFGSAQIVRFTIFTRCAMAIREAFARQGPVSPCAICLNECDPEDAFTWPCHHCFHPDCVSIRHARTPQPDCPLCHAPPPGETDRQFRNVCAPCDAPEEKQPPHIVCRLPPARPTVVLERATAHNLRP